MGYMMISFIGKPNYITSWAIQNTEGEQLPRINSEGLLEVKIPFSLLEKQQKIVEFLDVQSEALERACKLRENVEKNHKNNS